MRAAEARRVKTTLFITCLVDLFQPDTGVAAVKVLRASGCEVSCPMGQTCCGQPAWNSGFAEEAAKVARTTLTALEADNGDVVVVPAGSCATMMKVFWPEMFEVVGDHDAAQRARKLATKTFEFSEFIDQCRRDGALPDVIMENPPRVAYHHSCHMLRELRIHDAPEDLLGAMGSVQVEWPDADRCCGFGGLFSMKLPETSVAMADEKLRSIPKDADMLVGSDGSCLMHLRGRVDHEHRFLPVKHLAELLADALDTPLVSVHTVGPATGANKATEVAK
jgi:L-lactate dehydrogenase complex protein LldE